MSSRVTGKESQLIKDAQQVKPTTAPKTTNGTNTGQPKRGTGKIDSLAKGSRKRKTKAYRKRRGKRSNRRR